MPAELERIYDDHAQALFAFLLNFTRDEAAGDGAMWRSSRANQNATASGRCLKQIRFMVFVSDTTFSRVTSPITHTWM